MTAQDERDSGGIDPASAAASVHGAVPGAAPASDAQVAHAAAVADVFAGWDPAGPPPLLDGSPPFPTDTVIALGAMGAGMALGLLAGGRHPLLRVKLGGLLGLAGAIVARRMWRLEA
jgi:hypothetical protein